MSASFGNSTLRGALALAALLALALPASAQPKAPLGPSEDEGPALERVWVPKRSFTQVLARHPGGVLLTETELNALIAKAKAQAKAGNLPPQELSPHRLATIEALEVTGTIAGETASLEARARVAVQGGRVALALPLGGIGLTGVWVGTKPAPVLVTDAGPVVLLESGAGTQEVRWSFGLTVQPAPEGERGAGRLRLQVPPVASGSLRLEVPGEVEPVALPGSPGTTWLEPGSSGHTRLRVAFGGGSGASGQQLALAWRPRRALDRATPYVSAHDASLFTLHRGGATLDARLTLAVFRADRTRFSFELPPGFVVRTVSSPDGEPAYAQREARVEVVWPTPRRGQLRLHLSAERPSSSQSESALELRPLRWLDVDRSSGVLALAAGQDTVVRFPEDASGLERADLGHFHALNTGLEAAGLVRLYRHVNGAGRLPLVTAPLAPRISLGIQAAIRVEARQLEALAFYRYTVSAGAVYVLRAELPEGFGLEHALVRDAKGVEPVHRLSERRLASGRVEVIVELEEGLRAPGELLVAVQCEREVPRGVAAEALAIPHFTGTPRTELRGLLGFSSDPTFRLSGTKLRGLLAIPAAELPRAGLEAEDLALGYRVEGENYEGTLQVARRETQLSVEQHASHTVAERILSSAFRLDLNVSGAPLQELDLFLPTGTGELARITGVGVLRERERVSAMAGHERWRIAFVEPWSGERELWVEFQTTHAPAEGVSELNLPQVQLADSARQRGTIAVYSAGDVELSATPRALRTLEVTEVPRLFPSRAEQRPLFAYRWVRSDHGLTIGVGRPGQTPVLSAIAESLALSSSAAEDGTSRHTATFTLKNLDNQFFGLVLPDGATLWSVSVDGEGVKPAAEGEVLIVPIPQGTRAGGQTQVTAVYTQAADAWGLLGDARLAAPALTFGSSKEDRVPVLQTTWRVSLPEDTRVLEVAGNLVADQRLTGLEPVATRVLRAWRREPGAWGFLGVVLVGLLVVASGRGRAGLLGGARVGYRAAVGTRGFVVEHRDVLAKVGVGVLALGVVAMGCLALTTLFSAGRSEKTAAQAPYAADFEVGGADEGADRGPAGGKWGGMPGAPPAPAPPTTTALRDELKKAGQERQRGRRRYRKAKNEDFDGRAEESDEEAPAAEPEPAAPPKADAPTRQPMIEEESLLPEERQEAAKANAKRPKVHLAASREDGGMSPPETPDLGVENDAKPQAPRPKRGLFTGKDLPAGSSGAPEKEATDSLGKLGDKALDRSSVVDAYGVGGGAAGAYGQRFDKGRSGGDDGDEDALSSALNTRAKQNASGEVAAARFNDLGAGGEAGLRSLVLQLSSVGQDSRFERTGGGAVLELRLASERLLLALGGLFALLGLLGALFVPARARLSGLALVVTGLALASALPLALGLGPVPTAVCNALSVGLLVAAPVLGLGALSRVWARRPFARLLELVREG